MTLNSGKYISDQEVEEENLRLACAHHMRLLSRNLRKKLRHDDYGNVILDERPAEIEKFVIGLGLSVRSIGIVRAIKTVLAEMERLEAKRPDNVFSSSDSPTDGLEFEHWVAQSLEKFGWQAKATQGSGDQGVDVVATKDGLSLGLQCKRYTGAVGNKAVQEAFSGAKHMGLDKAGVLTNAEFTKSAKELAASTGVLLLSPDDIPRLHEQLHINK